MHPRRPGWQVQVSRLRPEPLARPGKLAWPVLVARPEQQVQPVWPVQVSKPVWLERPEQQGKQEWREPPARLAWLAQLRLRRQVWLEQQRKPGSPEQPLVQQARLAWLAQHRPQRQAWQVQEHKAD
jgi:hypothetical protein